MHQTFQDFELLLIDDGSKDNTLEVCRKYEQKDKRIIVYTHSNRGVSYTRNRGIKLAKNELLVFIDGDDYVKPDYIETLFDAYDEGIWPICGMINVKKGIEQENAHYIDPLKNYPWKIEPKKNLKDLIAYYSLGTSCTRIYSKSVITENNFFFPENISYQEDLLFNLAYYKHIDRVRLLDYFGYYYIEHQTSSTGRYHPNFNHIDRLYQELVIYVNSKADKEVLQEFILQTCLRKISNVFHPNSVKNTIEKHNELNEMFKIEYYSFSEKYIDKLNINYLLKMTLKFKNSSLISFYFKLLHGK